MGMHGSLLGGPVTVEVIAEDSDGMLHVAESLTDVFTHRREVGCRCRRADDVARCETAAVLAGTHPLHVELRARLGGDYATVTASAR